MNPDAGLAIALLLSYLVGSIPTGLWLGLWIRKVDIRQHGSQNIGATNTMRVLGKPLGAAALAGDMLKGVIAVVGFATLSAWPHAPIACGVAAIMGHTFSIFLKFQGGKGVATSTGVFLALAPIPTLAAAVVFVFVVWLTRMVSAGSITAAIVLTVSVFAIGYSWAICAAASLVCAFVIIKHRSNLRRILNGTENRV